MPSSEEVLASPTPQRRPLLRAAVAVVVLGLVASGVVARLSEDDESEAPAAAPASLVPAASSDRPALDPTTVAPPPWVRYPSRLEGHWVGEEGSARVTLVVSNARLTLWQGTGPQTARTLLGYRNITVTGHRVHVRPISDEGETATYRWRLRHEHLTFDLVERTPKAALRLETVRFLRVG